MKYPFLITSLIAGSLHAADPLPYGHKDFVPTPERPINFRTGGNGYYPGATPPTEWSEGTPVQIEMPGTYGNPPKKTAKVWDFADNKSTNLLWKVPVAGWGYAHPIVVRDWVISLGHPHFVTCHDLKTGKLLWQREALPLLCDGQPEDKARAVQVAIDLARALCMVGRTYGSPFRLVIRECSTNDATGFQERAAKISRLLTKYRPQVEKTGDPDLLKALDADLALTTSWEKTTNSVETLQAMMNNKPFSMPKSKLAEVFQTKYKTPMSSTWSGYVGFSDSAPCSDGERVYAVFGQGQVVCYDLDGKLVWAKRQKLPNAMLLPFGRPPLVCGNRLIVKDAESKNIECRDKRTGELVWTYPWPHNNGSHIQSLRIANTNGTPVDVLILPEHHKIVRLSDGKELGEFRSEKHAPAYHILTWDDTDTIAVGGKSTSGPTEPSACYRIKMTGPDSATGELVYECEKDVLISMNWPTATDTHFFGMKGGIYDRKTGAKVGQMPGLGQSSVIAGKFLITQHEWAGPYGRNRNDKMAMCGWRVIDISDPANPRQVNQGLNLLGYKDPPVDYVVKNYLSEFDSFEFAGCYQGTPSYFGTDLAGVVPHGNRILIQSTAYLYCIGEK